MTTQRSPYPVQKVHRIKNRTIFKGIFFLQFVIFSFFLPAGGLKSQSLESGTPWFSRIYPPAEYQGHSQNWAVTQLSTGQIVFGNTNGLLIYDGFEWKKSDYNGQIRALASGKTDKLYYGGKNDFGYFRIQADSLIHKSLISELSPADSIALGTVWHVFKSKATIFYLGSNLIVSRKGNTNTIIKTNEQVHTAFAIEDDIYVKLRGNALYKLSNNSLIFVPGTEALSNSRVSSIVRRPDNQLLISTPHTGSYLLSNSTFSAFPTQLDSIYQADKLYNSCMVNDSTTAMLTIDNGIYLIDQDGNKKAHYNAPNLLADATAHSCIVDRTGQLWVTHNYGISRVDLSIDLTFYGSFYKRANLYNHDELHGKISSIDYFENFLFVGTQSGLYRLDPEQGFVKILQINSAVKDLEVVAGKLWIGTINGLYSLNKLGNIEAISAGIAHSVYDLLVVPGQSGDTTLFVGGKKSLIQLNPFASAHENSEIPNNSNINEILRTATGDGDFTNLILTESDQVWGVLNDNTIFTLNTINNTDQFNLHQYTLQNKDLINVLLYISGDSLILMSDQKRFHIQVNEPLTDSLSPTPVPNVARTNAYLSKNINLNDWRTIAGKVQIGNKNNAWQLFLPLANQNIDVQLIYQQKTGITWFAAGLTLFRYDPGKNQYNALQTQASSSPLTITSVNKLLANKRVPQKLSLTNTPFTIFEQDTLQFTWRLFNFQNDQETQFRYQLGDQSWSDWSLNQSVSLERLASQKYSFQVQAQTPMGNIVSQKVDFIVENTPVWYRNSWLDVLYFLTGMALVIYLLVYLLSRNTKRRNLKLMAEIEILQQAKKRARLLEEANTKLIEANRIREEFVAITSHEIRTPLTSIIGFAGILQEEGTEIQQEFAGAILNSNERLLKMLNDLLELAGLKARGISQESKPVNVYQEANRIVQLVQADADRKRLNLVLLAPADLACFVDGFCLSRILENLVVNAVKFTDQGLVAINISESEGILHLAVSDTGRGISEHFLPDIYKPFRQESNGVKRSHEGSGLGLAITRLVTELAGGTISIKSVLGKGTTVFVELPLLNETQSKIIETNPSKIELSLG